MVPGAIGLSTDALFGMLANLRSGVAEHKHGVSRALLNRGYGQLASRSPSY